MWLFVEPPPYLNGLLPFKGKDWKGYDFLPAPLCPPPTSYNIVNNLIYLTIIFDRA